MFPGQEIVQPTVVERGAFVAWKDEAFDLWRHWGNLYQSGSASRDVLEGVRESWYLVNLVDNNFKSCYTLCDLLDRVNTETGAEVGH